MKLQRHPGNPILSPNPENAWESLVTTNPAAWYEEAEHKVYLLYRAAGNDPEHVVQLGLAVSEDGFNFTRVSNSPVLSPIPGTVDGGSIEDPRIVKFGDWYYVTYACLPFPGGQYWRRGYEKSYVFQTLGAELPQPFSTNGMVSCLALTRDFRTWHRLGRMTDPCWNDHDVIIFPEKIGGKYAVLHRPFKGSVGDNLPGIWLALTDNPLDLSGSRPLIQPELDWEGIKIGGNTPPVRTDQGWLVLYHGVGHDRLYRLGALLLDLDDPYRILHKSDEAILEPREPYELKGCHNYDGVVFPCGNIVMDGKLIVYYGAADKYVGVASCDLAELVEHIMHGSKSYSPVTPEVQKVAVSSNA